MTKLRVLTLNVWNTEGDTRRIAAINHELGRLNPDVIALQEVVQHGETNQLETLLNGLDLHATHQNQVSLSVPPYAERYGGTAVATRWPHRIVEVADLRVTGAPDNPWSTLAAVVSIADEGEMLFIAATGAWRLDAEAARERQVVALAELDARHRRELPTIIAGDLNATPDAASIRYLSGLQSLDGCSAHYHDAWAVAGEGPGCTWSTDNPNGRSVIDQIVGQPNHRRRIDYIFVGSWHAHPEAHSRILSADLAFNSAIDGIWVSDHCGVVVDLDVARA